MSVCFGSLSLRLFVVVPFVRRGCHRARSSAEGAVRVGGAECGGVRVREWGGLPREVALGFSVPPRCATVFNDNMVAQAVAAPLRK